jgi:parallel beta-helix repeat protein
MNKPANRGALLALIAGAFLGNTAAAASSEPRTVTVNCSAGKTLAKALERGNEDRPLLVLVRGTCNETVTIDRDDVTLRGEAGFAGAIVGPDPAADTLTILSSRVAIEDLAISGGRNGIVSGGAGRLAIRGTTVQLTGRTGIVVGSSSGATIDGSTIQLNPRDGVSVEGSQATIINSSVSQNGRVGVFVGVGASVRVGIDNANNAAPSTVSQNGASGINVFLGGAALIGNSTVTQNGADPASTTGRSGISVTQGTADIAGSNTVANNAGQGIFVRSGTVQIGNTSFAFSSANTITGNGSAAQPGGVFGLLGASLVIRDALISSNQGFGVGLSTRSQAQLFNSQILNNVAAGTNAGDGIRVFFGSALTPFTPPSVVTGNAGAGLVCFDPESSAINLALLGSAGNGAPDNCTGF